MSKTRQEIIPPERLLDVDVRILGRHDPARLHVWPLPPLKRSNVDAHVLLSLLMLLMACGLIAVEFTSPMSSSIGVSAAAGCAAVGYHYLQDARHEARSRRIRSKVVWLEPESNEYASQIERLIAEAPRPNARSRFFSGMVFLIVLTISITIIYLSITGHSWGTGWFAIALSAFNMLTAYSEMRYEMANRPICLDAFINLQGINLTTIDQNGNA